MKTNVKDINIKSQTYYFYNSTTNIENIDPDNIKIYEKLYKNILIYYIGYVTIKKELKMYSINPLYLIFNKVDGYLVKINGNKFLTLVPTNESKEETKTYEELWIKIRDLIRSITENLDDYDEKYIQIKFH